MTEQPPTSENVPVERPLVEVEPRLEKPIGYIEQEVQVLPQAVAARARESGDVAVRKRGIGLMRRNLLASALAFTTLATVEGAMPRPAQGGEKGRKAAEIGSVIFGEASRSLDEAYYQNIANIQELGSMWEQKEAEKEGLRERYRQIAEEIDRLAAEIDQAEARNNARDVRKLLERQHALSEEQVGIGAQRAQLSQEQFLISQRSEQLRKGSKKANIGRFLGRIISKGLEAGSRPSY